MDKKIYIIIEGQNQEYCILEQAVYYSFIYSTRSCWIYCIPSELYFYWIYYIPFKVFDQRVT